MAKQIIARKVTIIQKNPGVRIDYTHVTELHNVFLNELGKHCWLIEGETEDITGERVYTYDKIPIEQLELMIIEFYIPKI